MLLCSRFLAWSLHEAVESLWSIQGGRPTPYDRWATLSLVVGPSSLIMSGYVSLWVLLEVDLLTYGPFNPCALIFHH